MKELQNIIKSAQSDLDDWIKDNPGNDEPHDTIFEIADSSTPIYTGDILQCAMDNLSLATAEPELGPAFDGKPTPINIIAANIFEYIESALWEYFNDHKDDYLEDESEDEDGE